MKYTHQYASSLGNITAASDGETLIGLWFERQKHSADISGCEPNEKSLPIFAETDQWLDIYFSGHEPNFTPALSIKTTEFRKIVWEILLTIPFGQTMTYGEIAKMAAKKRGLAQMSAQAIGGAVGHNPISLIIPCHRVVGKDGRLTGYAGGIQKKKFLLELEGAFSASKAKSFESV